MANQYIKEGYMTKKSINKRTIFSPDNFKARWFTLDNVALRYYDGSLEKGKTNEKGKVEISSIKVVEEVEDGKLEGKLNTFQIGFHDSSEQHTLYITAQTDDMRKDWVQAIRDVCQSQGVEFDLKYHSGVFQRNLKRFNCCDQINKNSPGCQPTFNQPENARKQNGLAGSSTLSVRDTPLPPIPPNTPARDPRNSKTFVIALYDYQGAADGDLSITKGEEYEVIDNSKEHWWTAKNKKGEKGYIPANYVEVVTSTGLESYDWYHKNITRHRAEEMLKAEGKEGCFIVRDSSTKGMYTVSIYTKESGTMVLHYHIKQFNDGMFYISEKFKFPTIPDVIKYHKCNSGGLVVRLRSPPTGTSQPSTAGFGHDIWEIDPTELELFEELGRGQFGSVKRGKWRKNKSVAVKMMQQGMMNEDDFIDEAKTMKMLQHENLVQLYGVCSKQRPIYIVIEYMKHGSLLNYLKRQRGVILKKPNKLLDMCLQVCRAMKYLESQSFIHRDLAARNCLVGDNLVVKVGDFGLARYVLDDEYTSSSGTKFPIKWAPPEVLGYTRFSSKSDVWAFGVLMWEIFTGGDMPYGKIKNQEVVEQVVHHGKRLEKPQACPGEVYDIMMVCWEKDERNRPGFAVLENKLANLSDDDYCS
ncbi:unnamed protein product [Owenia fusiformis]|uniref:Tyrosine-protein kinase n=1 Tax=Owenia fusiformis TaxID=6347 RepID=A0A8J1XKR5_OWEFU|nr:unnamed protein product [Owenia fusiformis]